MSKLRRLKFLMAVLFAVVFALALPSAGASSANISHSYKTTDDVANGSLVSLDSDRTDYVVLSNTDNGDRLLGVSVATNDSLLAVDPNENAVQVATSGSANVLVSTLNGDIKVGDQIAVSPFNGVGMKSEPGSHIIGLAQTAFNADTDGSVARDVTTKDGKKNTVYLGFVKISIGIGTASSASSGSSENLTSLQRLGKSLTGHVISTPRILISLVVALVAAVALVTLIYASIYGSIISVGRNPLARNAIVRTLGSVLAMAAMTAGVAAAIIWLLLH
jgi:hypothetical protein